MAQDWKERLGVVYSTNPDFSYESEEKQTIGTIPPEKQKLLICLDKRNRKGKAVTLISGFVGSANDLNELGKLLKNKCGAGGSSKDNEILIQGDFRDKILQILQDAGYKRTKRGN